MRTNNLKSAIIKGICNGMISATIVNVWVIISLYTSLHSIIFYVMGVLAAVITYLILKNKVLKFYLVSCLCSVILFLVAEVIISNAGIIPSIYKNIYNDYSISAGDGFGLMVIYAFNVIGSFVGGTCALITTIINTKTE